MMLCAAADMRPSLEIPPVIYEHGPCLVSFFPLSSPLPSFLLFLLLRSEVDVPSRCEVEWLASRLWSGCA